MTEAQAVAGQPLQWGNDGDIVLYVARVRTNPSEHAPDQEDDYEDEEVTEEA